jgi:hypothetical protein
MRALAEEIAIRAAGAGVDVQRLRRLLEIDAHFGALGAGATPMLFASTSIGPS